MEHPFEPANDLERALAAALRNQMPVATFMQTLLTAQVFVLVDRDPPPGKLWHSQAAPMILSNAEQAPFLALFTAPERAQVWRQHQTAFGVGITTDFASVLKGMEATLGIAINPGHQVGFEMQSATLAALRGRVR